MISKRDFIKAALFALWTCCFKGVAAALPAPESEEMSLRLYNIHTGEHLETTYCRRGCYNENEVHCINHLLRCHYVNREMPISLKVVDLLCRIKDKLGYDREISIISGYRSPEYNEYLRRLGHHVAAGSLHMTGLAIDFSMPGIATGELARVAKAFSAGGVGKYSDFIHIDVGRVRYW